jgi:hypothetical protein
MKEDAPIYFMELMSTGPNTNTSWPGGQKVRDDVEQILGVTGGTIRPISLRTLEETLD